MIIDSKCEVEYDPRPCGDCGAWLTAVEVDHGLEGFGHQGRCCACYEQHIRGGSKRAKRHRAEQR